MLRILVVAIATLLLALPTSAAAQTGVSGGTSDSSCVGTASSGLGTAATASSGGADPSAGSAASDGSSSGGTPVSSDSGLTPISNVTPTGEPPVAQVAQEPEPEPEGGQEQPTEPGGQPQEPSGELPTAPGVDAPAEDTGGGLPRTGLEVLKLVLLGLVLFLVGARLRVLLKRRRSREPAVDGLGTEPAPAAHTAELAPDGLPHEAPTVAVAPSVARTAGDEHEPLEDGGDEREPVVEDDCFDANAYEDDGYEDGAYEHGSSDFSADPDEHYGYEDGAYEHGSSGAGAYEHGPSDAGERAAAPPAARSTSSAGWRERTRAALGASSDWGEVDEWDFPDPNEPSPSGLLPSTAVARRRGSPTGGRRD